MNVIVTLDDRNGMLFNHRRQSRDAVVNDRILALCAGSRLFVNAYTAKLFGDCDALTVDEDPLKQAAPGDWCFVEDLPLAPYEKRVEKLIVFRWNRHYPSDRRLDIDLSGWKKLSVADFPGQAHETLSEEVYIP